LHLDPTARADFGTDSHSHLGKGAAELAILDNAERWKRIGGHKLEFSRNCRQGNTHQAQREEDSARIHKIPVGKHIGHGAYANIERFAAAAGDESLFHRLSV
jgi:hypothetical protein